MSLVLFEIEVNAHSWWVELLTVETARFDRSLFGIYWQENGGLESLDLFWIRLTL